MSHRKISAALSKRLQSLPDLPEVAWENARFTPTDGELYLAEKYIPAANTPYAINGTDDFTGVYQVSIYAPLDEYKLEAHTMADKVAAHFVRGTKLTEEGIDVIIENVSIAPALTQDGWFQIPVSIDYRALI